MTTKHVSTTSSSSATSSDLVEAERLLEIAIKDQQTALASRLAAEKAFAKIGRPLPLFDRLND
jgi:hypothetical protein